MAGFDPKAFAAQYGGAPAQPVAGAPVPEPVAQPTVAAPTAGFDPKAFATQYNKPKEDVVQEMHPDFTAKDRFVVKNFASGDEQAVSYLQARHPNLEIRVAPDGQIQAKKKGAKDEPYRVLDPDSGLLETIGGLATFQPEAWQDLGDVGYDLASGVGTGLATGAAGVAGGAASGGTMALPAAAAAGAGASMGFEGLKQGIGKALGIEDNFDATNLGIAGATGALSPLLLGTGATAGQLAKGAIKNNLDDAGRLALQQAQRGAIGRGVDRFGKPLLAKIGSMASGASEDSLKTLGAHYDDIVRLEKDPEAITNFTKAAGQQVGNKLRGAKTAAWETYEGALQQAADDGASIPVGHVSEPLKEALAKAVAIAKETKTEGSKELASELRAEFRRLFTYMEPKIDPATGEAVLDAAGKAVMVRRELDELSPMAAARLEQMLGDMGKLKQLKPDRLGVGNRFNAGQGVDDKALAGLGVDMKKRLAEALEEAIGGEGMAARGAYGQVVNLEKRAAPLLKNPQKAFSTLRNADKTPNAPTAELFQKLDTTFGTDLTDRARIMEAYSTFAKPSAVPLSGAGATSTSRSVPLAIGGGALGYWAGSTQGGEGRGTGMLGGAAGSLAGGFLGSPAMMRRAIAAGIKGGKVNQFFAPLRSGVGGQMMQPAVEFGYEQYSPWRDMK